MVNFNQYELTEEEVRVVQDALTLQTQLSLGRIDLLYPQLHFLLAKQLLLQPEKTQEMKRLLQELYELIWSDRPFNLFNNEYGSLTGKIAYELQQKLLEDQHEKTYFQI